MRPDPAMRTADLLPCSIRAARDRLGIAGFLSGEIDDQAPVVERPAGAKGGPA